VSEAAEPALGEDERHGLAKGVGEFNAGYFFECHDTLEEVWSGVRGPAREFFQGLIQVSVGFYHFGNGNRGGASTMLERGLKRLAKYPDRYCRVDLARFRLEVAQWRTRIEAGEGFPDDPARLPKYRLEAEPPAGSAAVE
jgi:predicted metal-dependent hydrolase